MIANKKDDFIRILRYKKHSLEIEKNKIPQNDEEKIYEFGKRLLIYDEVIKMLEDSIYFNNLKKYYGI